ncbi:MAG: hypothetical protein HC887_10565 [Desulfobacteraceae bacterium]|nr:hypothetical protein [Desulfobacteraceae bacterium]
MSLKRPHMPLLNIDRRRTIFQQVELGYTEDAAREEALRCLRCDICRRCGECVLVCRDKMKIDALQIGYLDFDHPVETDFRATQQRCISCGACAANCSNHAMQLNDINGKRVLSLCGTVLNNQELVLCEDCGAAMGTARYLEYIQHRTQNIGKTYDNLKLCDVCLRKKTARQIAETSMPDMEV